MLSGTDIAMSLREKYVLEIYTSLLANNDSPIVKSSSRAILRAVAIQEADLLIEEMNK